MIIRSTSLVACSWRRAIEPNTKAQTILAAKDWSAAFRDGNSPAVFSNMPRSSRKMGERVSALKYARDHPCAAQDATLHKTSQFALQTGRGRMKELRHSEIPPFFRPG